MPVARSTRYGAFIKSIDPFAVGVRLTFDDGHHRLSSWLGVLTGIAVTILLFNYGASKLHALQKHPSVMAVQPPLRDYFNDSYSFTPDQGFQLAFGLAGFAASEDGTILVDGYGSVKLYERIWGERDEDGQLMASQLRAVQTEPCKIAYFPSGNHEGPSEEHRFFPLAEQSAAFVEQNMASLLCTKSDYAIRGDSSSQTGSTLLLAFERCDSGEDSTGCKQSGEIDQWLRRKFLITVTNEVTFSAPSNEE